MRKPSQQFTSENPKSYSTESKQIIQKVVFRQELWRELLPGASQDVLKGQCHDLAPAQATVHNRVRVKSSASIPEKCRHKDSSRKNKESHTTASTGRALDSG